MCLFQKKQIVEIFFPGHDSFFIYLVKPFNSTNRTWNTLVEVLNLSLVISSYKSVMFK